MQPCLPACLGAHWACCFCVSVGGVSTVPAWALGRLLPPPAWWGAARLELHGARKDMQAIQVSYEEEDVLQRHASHPSTVKPFSKVCSLSV